MQKLAVPACSLWHARALGLPALCRNSTIGARCRSRCAVFVERTKLSSSAALCRRQDNSCRFRDTAHALLNHDSFFTDSGYW